MDEIASDVAIEFGSIDSDVNSRLSILRELDSIIDFARGSLQLRIILTLAEKGALSAREIASILNERYKAVLDAIRKLVLKGLVSRDENDSDVYRLASDGVDFYRKLSTVLNGKTYTRISREERRALLSDIAMNIVRYNHLLDALIALATSRRGEISLNDIADAMKLSIDRAKTYMDIYTEKRYGFKLFRRIEKKSKTLEAISKILKRFGIKIRSSIVLYRITDEGLSIFYKHPYYIKYRKSLASKIATKMFNSSHPRIVLRKMSIYIMLTALIWGAITLYIQTPIAIALEASLVLANTLLYIAYKAI
jgi:DNA-binding MarR family transcriptional regulator